MLPLPFKERITQWLGANDIISGGVDVKTI